MRQTEMAYPHWTDYRKKNGLDPLGMQNSSIDLYQKLLPGISNVTLRVRYYGFYAWLAITYATHDGHTRWGSWQRFVRYAEALYALAASHNGDGAGVAGVRWATAHLARTPGDRVSFAQNADPEFSTNRYLKQATGAYGAAYGSQLFGIGVLAEVPGHDLPAPSEAFGEALALSFAEALGDAGELFHVAIRRGDVTLNELTSFARMTPSAIERQSTERHLYEDLLFGRGPLERRDDLARRDTLLLVLKAARQLKAAPDVSSLRWLLYSGYDNDGLPFSCPDIRLEGQRQRWRAYQANDLLHYAYETLLKFALDILEGYPGGITLATLINEGVLRILEVVSRRLPEARAKAAARQD